MAPLVDLPFGIVILSGAVLAAVGYALSRRSEPIGVTSLAAFALVLGLGSVFSGVLGLVLENPAPPAVPQWSQFGLFFWAIAAVPWFLFALSYTGRYTQIRWQTVGLLYLPLAGIAGNFAWLTINSSVPSVANAIVSIIFLYTLALVFSGALLLVQATRSYVHLSVWDGVALSTTPILVMLALNSVGNLRQTSTALAPVIYAFSLVLSTISFSAVLSRGAILDQTPAVETIGTRAIAQETDDLVFVTDRSETVIECNPRVIETLPVDRQTILGRSLAASLDHTPEQLRERETVALETTAGKRQYDPQVSDVATDGGTELGAVLSLRDVTDRQLREQRLAVLNRVLRHNLRNKIDVIKSHAEVLRDDRPNQHVSAITDTADDIRDLGYEARTIDRFLSESTTRQADIVDVFAETRGSLAVTESEPLVTVDAPETAPVVTNRQALAAALDSALENALSYADSTVEVSIEPNGDGYTVAVSDDGSGIPEQELRSIDSGTETPLQHGTGLGLWQLKWAVTTMGGELSFETTEGTTVRFTVPDLR
jgi:signal transduction histidine kinase